MKDKRIAPRRETLYYLTVAESASGEILGRIVDLSASGMMIVGERALPEGVPMAVRVDIPHGIAGVSSFACVITRRWQRPDRNPALKLMGCTMEPDANAAAVVALVMSRYSFGGSVSRDPDDQ